MDTDDQLASSPAETSLPERPVLLFLLSYATTMEYRVGSGVSFTVIELLCYLALPMVFLDLVARPHSFKVSFQQMWKWNGYLQFYFLWVAFLSLFHMLGDADLSVMRTFRELLPSWILVSFLFLYCRNKRSVRLVLIALLLGAVVNVTMGSSQAIVGMPRPTPLQAANAAKMDIDGARVGTMVATAWFAHPNVFAMLMIPFAPLLLLVALGRIELSRVWRALAVLALPVLGFAMIKSYGKGAMLWMAYAVAFAFMPRLSGRARWHAMTWITCASIAGIAGAAAYLAADNKSLETIFTRVQLWGAALEAVGTDPLLFFFGNAFDRTLVLSYWYTNGHTPYPTAHNGVLTQAVCYGVPGLLIYLACLVRATRNLLASPAVGALGASLPGVVTFVAAGFFGLFGESFFEPSSTGVVLPAQLFFLLGLAGVLSLPALQAPTKVRRSAY